MPPTKRSGGSSEIFVLSRESLSPRLARVMSRGTRPRSRILQEVEKERFERLRKEAIRSYLGWRP